MYHWILFDNIYMQITPRKRKGKREKGEREKNEKKDKGRERERQKQGEGRREEGREGCVGYEKVKLRKKGNRKELLKKS